MKKNFERELFKKSICLVNHLVKVDIYGSTNTNKANIEKLWPIRDVFGVKKKVVLSRHKLGKRGGKPLSKADFP